MRTREILSGAGIDDHIAKLRAEIPELRSQIQAARKPGSGIAAARKALIGVSAG